MMTPRRIAFARIAAAALGHADMLARRWLPDGRREGAEWVALNPTRADHRRGSFKVNLRDRQMVRLCHRRRGRRSDRARGLSVPSRPGGGGAQDRRGARDRCP